MAKIMTTADRIAALPDDLNDARGGVFVYDKSGSQIDELPVADLKSLIALTDQLTRQRDAAVEALTRFRDIATSVHRYMTRKPVNAVAITAVMAELSLDNGHCAQTALDQIEAIENENI